MRDYRYFVQATSYCETAAELFEFCGCVPAYFVPATPLVLNAEPGAVAVCTDGVTESCAWQDWLG